MRFLGAGELQRRLARLFLGSTTEKVIAHSKVPVYAIPREK